MTRPRMWWVLVLGALCACSPALNWRQAPISGMTAMLPCKPDTAERTVSLGGQTLPMQMVGCEAEGGLFAVSHVEAPSAAAAVALLQTWQQESLALLGAPASTPVPYDRSAWAQEAVGVRATGRSADGKPLQAHLRWLVKGAHIYHLAVYGAQLNDTMTDPLTLEP